MKKLALGIVLTLAACSGGKGSGAARPTGPAVVTPAPSAAADAGAAPAQAAGEPFTFAWSVGCGNKPWCNWDLTIDERCQLTEKRSTGSKTAAGDPADCVRLGAVLWPTRDANDKCGVAYDYGEGYSVHAASGDWSKNIAPCHGAPFDALRTLVNQLDAKYFKP